MIQRRERETLLYSETSGDLGYAHFHTNINSNELAVKLTLVPIRPKPTLKTWMRGSGMTAWRLAREGSGKEILPRALRMVRATTAKMH